MIVNFLAIIGVIALIFIALGVVMCIAIHFNEMKEHEQATKEAKDYYRGWIDEEKRWEK